MKMNDEKNAPVFVGYDEDGMAIYRLAFDL